MKLRIHEDSLRFATEPFRRRAIPGDGHPHGIATLWLGFDADLQAGKLFAVDMMEAQYRQDCICVLLPIVADGNGPGI